jgi:hypothetical protein
VELDDGDLYASILQSEPDNNQTTEEMDEEEDDRVVKLLFVVTVGKQTRKVQNVKRIGLKKGCTTGVFKTGKEKLRELNLVETRYLAMCRKGREKKALEDKLFEHLTALSSNYNQMLARLKEVSKSGPEKLPAYRKKMMELEK